MASSYIFLAEPVFWCVWKGKKKREEERGRERKREEERGRERGEKERKRRERISIFRYKMASSYIFLAEPVFWCVWKGKKKREGKREREREKGERGREYYFRNVFEGRGQGMRYQFRILIFFFFFFFFLWQIEKSELSPFHQLFFSRDLVIEELSLALQRFKKKKKKKKKKRKKKN